MIYGKLPVVFLSTIATEKKDSTNSQIATYILEHIDQMQDVSIRELAQDCHCLLYTSELKMDILTLLQYLRVLKQEIL